MDEGITRRRLLTHLYRLGVGLAGLELLSNSRLLGLIREAEAKEVSKVAVARGGTVGGRVARAIKALGGMERFVKTGAKVVVKPNAGWARTPEQAANTNPAVVSALIGMCFRAGASQVTVYEHTCDNYLFAFRESGIKEAVEGAGGKLYSAHLPGLYRSLSLPKGKVLKSVKIIQPALEADCFINVPIAKVHSSAILTMGLKNLMGIVEDRDFWHTAGLNQCIADMITGFRPHLTVIDAVRILLTNGPKGPGEVRDVGQVIASADPLAADAYGTTLFGKRPGDIPYLVSAKAQTSGEIEMGKIEITKV